MRANVRGCGASPAGPGTGSQFHGESRYSGSLSAEYVCTLPSEAENPEDAGPVDERIIGLQCHDGSCHNRNGWFYKLNPCFSGQDGYVTYRTDYGESINIQEFNLPESGIVVTIDLNSGIMTTEEKTDEPLCGLLLVFLALIPAAFFSGARWN